MSLYGLSKALGLLRGHRVVIIIELALKPCAVCHFVQAPLKDLGCLQPLGHLLLFVTVTAGLCAGVISVQQCFWK